jgi:hypothetical protein
MVLDRAAPTHCEGYRMHLHLNYCKGRRARRVQQQQQQQQEEEEVSEGGKGAQRAHGLSHAARA